MECYYHPDRESTDTCAICGKSICKECGLEIAGKIYCKECLEKIVGLGIENKAEPVKETVAEPAPQVAPIEEPTPEPVPQEEPVIEPVRTEPARLNKKPIDESIYKPQAEQETYAPQEEIQPVHEIRQVRDDSPYNIKDTPAYSEGLESSYIQENEPIPQMEEPQIAQNEFEPAQKPAASSQEFIYPDHSYDPEPTSARLELEDKYEKYLDDLYFDENDVPLGEQLAKDEEQYGSLTRRPYKERPEEALLKEKGVKKQETPEEMEARIRAEILAETQGKKIKDTADTNIHNLNYQDEKEPMGAVDILLTIILIIVILVVLYYIIYVFVLSASYSTFMDAIFALSNPQNVINNILTPPPTQ
jgi:hypothetical protein